MKLKCQNRNQQIRELQTQLRERDAQHLQQRMSDLAVIDALRNRQLQRDNIEH